jgi:SAM-dependent methyltransferase
VSTAANASDPSGHHDWCSPDYVDRWISEDVLKDDQRRPLLRRLADQLPVPRAEASRVLDVGGGYGVFTGELLQSFPTSPVVLVDLSGPMLEQARSRLADYAPRLSFVQADLRDDSWTSAVDGPFEVVASAMAIHNVRYADAIRSIYSDIAGLLSSGGWFLNVDLVPPARIPEPGGSDDRFDLRAQMNYLAEIGMRAIDCVHREGHLAAIVAGK